MSRPTLTKQLDSDQLPFHKVNTHRRVYLEDVLDFRHQRLLRQRKAYEAMMLESGALGINEQLGPGSVHDGGVSDLDRAGAADILDRTYAAISGIVTALDEVELARPSRCAGWGVGDVLFHQLLDARRALRTFATPAPPPADVDDIGYWRLFGPDSGTDFALGSADSVAHARYVRIAAAAYPPGTLVGEWRDTSEAAVRAARACPYETVGTQGHVLRTGDFVATLVVEATVHHLDLTVSLTGAPDPDPAALTLVRRVLDGLLGQPLPVDWTAVVYALKGTGRLPLTPADRAVLSPLAAHFPLFG
jgi:uncharacterized protein (TIGR03083 family)